MNTVCHNQLTFESLFSKEIIADFEGGRITSEAGGQDRLGSIPGTVLCALGQELIRNGRRVYFGHCNLIVQELLRAKQELKLTWWLKKLKKYDAVILDDMVPPGRIRYPPAFGMHCQAILARFIHEGDEQAVIKAFY